jgi:hypothetical protein
MAQKYVLFVFEKILSGAKPLFSLGFLGFGVAQTEYMHIFVQLVQLLRRRGPVLSAQYVSP